MTKTSDETGACPANTVALLTLKGLRARLACFWSCTLSRLG